MVKTISTITLLACLALFSSQSIAGELSDSKAQKLVDSDCSKIRNNASFTVSSKCDFEVTDVDQVGSDGANVHVYSKGFLYNIKFTAVYRLNGSKYQLAGVRKGHFTGFSDFLQKRL